MKRLNVLFIGLCALFCAGCVAIKKPQATAQYGDPYCRNETMVAVYDNQGSYMVPGCVDYFMPWEDYDQPAGDFPEVENNKYPLNQVILQNQKTELS